MFKKSHSLLLVTFPTFAESSIKAPDLLSLALTTLLMVAFIIILGLIYKKVMRVIPGNDQIRVITSLQLGMKEKLVVIEINEKQHLLGVTGQAINYLTLIDPPLNNQQKPLANNQFKQVLQQALGKKIN